MTPTTDNTLTPETTMTLDNLKTLTRTIALMREEQHKIGRELPPVRFTDLCSDGCNITDRAFEAAVRDWMRVHMPTIDTTLLDREDYDKWELLTPRYEVREREGDDETVWLVWDYEQSEFVTQEDEEGNAGTAVFAEEAYAEDARHDLEADAEQARYGFPFAWNTGWALEDTYWLAELRAAGFLVYRYDGDVVIAGIDGGGYAFMGAHFAPLYAALAAKNDWLVETDDGPRRITLT